MSASIDLLIVFGAAACTATISHYWLRFSRKPKRTVLEKSNDETQQIWYLFDGSACKFASASALEILDVSSVSQVTWELLEKFIGPRFVSFPKAPLELEQEPNTSKSFPSASDMDSANLVISRSNGLWRLEIQDKTPANLADRHKAILVRNELSYTLKTIRKIATPIWITTRGGKVLWKNNAYEELEQAHHKQNGTSGSETLFLKGDGAPHSSKTERVSIALGPSQNEVHWFDLSCEEIDDRRLLFTALNVDKLINAETAQRKFVQTLAKTFAQLSTGLAIFDRNRRLVLFNPALVDLTDLPAHFLSAQPNLQSFFDKLRDKRIMPEPKDYSSWRKRIADLVIQAEDGRYQETWHLPNGLTYRIVGRPHPDGAIAILVEDISVEVSLTQRFRGQIELSNSVLENLNDAIVAFEPDGRVLLWNTAFKRLIGLPEDTSPSAHDAAFVLRRWRDKMETSSLKLLLAKHRGRKHSQEGSIALRDGQTLKYRFNSQDGSFSVITLFTSDLSVGPSPKLSVPPRITEVG